MEALCASWHRRTVHVWPGALERVHAAVRQVYRIVDAKSALIRSRGGGSGLETSRKLLGGVRDTTTMTWIVGPPFTDVAVVRIGVKPMAVEEDVGDEYRTAEPVGTPAPTPATPETEGNARSPSNSVCRIVQRRIGTPYRRAPDVSRVIIWHIDYIGVGRLNVDGRVDSLGLRGHRLLRCRRQVPIGLCRRAELLDRCHHVGLLSQKRIAQVRCPAYVLVQALQHVGKRDQCLHAGVKRLLFGCLRQLGSV